MTETTMTLGALATAHPKATHVLLRHRLDFCCGGRKPLDEACRESGLDPKKVLEEIAQAEQGTGDGTRWDTRPLPALVDFIVSRYHDSLRRDLPTLIGAATKVEHVHAAKESCPEGLSAALQALLADLKQHMQKEEEVLFPSIRSGGHGPQVHMPVRVLMQEHDDHGAALRELHELTDGFVPPPEACATWRALYSGLAKLEEELMEHIHLENNVLFPKALAAGG